MQEAEASKQGVHLIRKTLPDGAIVIAEKHGDIPRITIIPPPSGDARERTVVDEHFVTFPRDSVFPAGLDTDHPQLMLKPGDEQDWTTFFYNSAVTGYSGFGRAKGSYSMSRDVLVFPDGVTHAGNLDWVSADGVRVSWYGPPNRLFADPYVQPRSQFGTFVFSLGQVLLDVDAYQAVSSSDDADSHKWVLGACLRREVDGWWLYTVQTFLPTVATNTSNVPPNTREVSDPLTNANNTVFLLRYKLIEQISVDDAMRWEVTSNSREVLWSQVLNSMVQPWRFNESGTFAVASSTDNSNQTFVQNDATLATSPPSVSLLYTLDVNAASLNTTSVSIAPGADATATLAVDFVGDTPVYLKARRVGTDFFGLEFDGVVAPLETRVNGFVEGRTVTVVSRKLLYANIRDRTYVFTHASYVSSFAPDSRVGPPIKIEVYRDGLLVQTLDTEVNNPDTAARATLPGLFDAPDNVYPVEQMLTGVSVSPMFLLYGVWVFQTIPAAAFVGATAYVGGGIIWRGACFGFYGWPTTELYGAVGNNPPSAVRLLISGVSLNGADSNVADQHGKYSQVGCATYEGRTVFSAHGLSGYYSSSVAVGQSGQSVHWADFAPLTALTPINQPQNRYHPVWMLGAQPRYGT